MAIPPLIDEMILVTGAAGKTGRAVVKALASRNTAVRVLIHKESQRQIVESAGAAEFVVGDMANPAVYPGAMKGAAAVYFICPNVNPNEVEYATVAMEAARAADPTVHFVYHSVLHPQVEAMPHHWLKMRVEEKLFESGLPFTILQPAAYMQNILASWPSIVDEGVYRVPYSAETRHSLVDLQDVAEAAAAVLLDSNHYDAIYELAGPEALSQLEVAEIIGQKLKRPVTVEQLSIESWRERAKANGLGRYQIGALIRMFNYYDQYGFRGNPAILTHLLKRPPTSFAAFIDRVLS